MNHYEDSLYPEVIREINEVYKIDKIVWNEKIIVSDDLKKFFKEEIIWLKKLRIIDKETNELHLERYTILRNYIRRKSVLRNEWIEADEIMRLIEKLESKYWNSKQIGQKIKELWFNETDNTYRFYSYSSLDVWSMLEFHWFELYRKLLSFVWKDKGIYLDENNWDVFIDSDRIWTINLNTQQYLFFKYLYDNQWISKTHKEIKKYIIWDGIISHTAEAFCSNIKRRLDQPIRNLIKSYKWWYVVLK